MADTKIDMALDDIIKKNRNGPRNQRGRGGNNVQRRGGNNQRGNRGGRIGKPNNNNRNSGGNFRRGTGRNSFGQRNNNNINNNRSNNFRQQQRGKRNTIPGYNRRNFSGDKPTATYNPLSRDSNSSGPKQQQQQQQQRQTSPRKPQGSVFNKIRPNQNVTALRRRMVAAQRALNRATRTLAALPKIKQQRQRILQQPQKLRNIITRNRVAGGGARKRLNTGRKQIGRGGSRRMFV